MDDHTHRGTPADVVVHTEGVSYLTNSAGPSSTGVDLLSSTGVVIAHVNLILRVNCIFRRYRSGASDSKYSYTYLHSVVCRSVCRLSYLCSMLKHCQRWSLDALCVPPSWRYRNYYWRPNLPGGCCICLEQSAGVSTGIAVTASFSQQTEDRAFCPVVQQL